MKTAIVGAGFSGLVAASVLKRHNMDFVLYEAGERAGKKLLATGNGRCNISNVNVDISRYHGNKGFISAVIGRYGREALEDFFASIGVRLRSEGDKLYPYSLRASEVLDLLRLAEGKSESCLNPVKRLVPHKNSIGVVTGDGEKNFDRVLVCVGGKAAPKLSGGGSYGLLTELGHKITPLSPSIVQLKCDGTRALEGIKLNALVKIGDRECEGELLFTSYGISGPPVMQLSRGAKGKKAFVDLAPELSFGEVAEILTEKAQLGYLTLENLFTGFIHKKVGMQILKRAGIGPLSEPASGLSSRDIKKVASAVKSWELEITDTMGFENAQVTAGGIDLADFDENTMQSKLVRGVYAAGEMLDADGDCGGFNLQWAFSSAYLAAMSIINEERK